MLLDGLGQVQIASHGLIHSDHSQISLDAQEMSIVSSCNILNTKMFIPPFNRYNHTTIAVCSNHKIDLITPEQGWRSLDYEVLVKNQFDPQHKLWYMHPWRWTVGKFKEKVSSQINRFVQRNINDSLKDVSV